MANQIKWHSKLGKAFHRKQLCVSLTARQSISDRFSVRKRIERHSFRLNQQGSRSQLHTLLFESDSAGRLKVTPCRKQRVIASNRQQCSCVYISGRLHIPKISTFDSETGAEAELIEGRFLSATNAINSPLPLRTVTWFNSIMSTSTPQTALQLPAPPNRLRFWLVLGLVVAVLGIGIWNLSAVRLYRTMRSSKQAIEDRDYTKAQDLLQQALEADPENGEVHFLLARIYRHLGKQTELQTHIAKASELGFSPKRIQLEQLLLLAQIGQMNDAIPQLPRLLSEFSETDGQEICEAYVSGFFSTYNFPEAFRLAEVWQKDYPNDPQPYFSRGLYEAHVGSDTRAIEEFRKALQLAPRRDDVRRFLAESLMDLEQFDEAEVHIRYLVGKQKGNADLETALGHCMLEKGDLVTAREILNRALERDPTSRPTLLMLGQLELKDQNPEKAIELLEPLIKERPFDYNGRFQYATALQHAGRAAEAAEHLQFVGVAQSALGRVRNLMDKAKDDPEDIPSRLEIGLTLLKYDSPDDGAAWLRNVLQLDPNHLEAHRALSQYHESKGDAERSQFHQKAADELDKNADKPAGGTN